MTHALWSGIKHSTIYVYKWKYPPTNQDIDPKYQGDVNIGNYDDETDTIELREYIDKCNQWEWGALQMCNVFEYPYDYKNEYIPFVPKKREMWDHGLQAYAIKRWYAEKLVERFK